jgi:hypothetical protein
MVDNINLNKISPLLSSAERIKGVDRKSRNSQQSPFKGAQQDKQKKKKKKKHRPDENPSGVTASSNGHWNSEQAIRSHSETKTKSTAGRSQKIIDIRV